MRKLVVVLTTGYEVDVLARGGWSHLTKAVYGETLTRMREQKERTKRKDAEEPGRFFRELNDLCILELFFVAGQLLRAGHPVAPMTLVTRFEKFWDRIARLSNRKAPNRSRARLGIASSRVKPRRS